MKKWVGVAIIALLAGSGTAQEQPGAEAFKRGQEAAQKGDWDTAIPALEKALSENPNVYFSHYLLGFAYSNKRDFGKAGENFLKFLEKVQADEKAAADAKAAELITNANRYGGIALARAGNAQRAVPLLENAVAAKPNDEEAHFFLGVVLLQSNLEAKAQEHFSKVIQLNPQLADPYYYSGRIAFNRDNFSLAEERLQKFLSVKPDSPFAADAHFMLGTMAVRGAEGAEPTEAQHQTAKEHLEKFLSLKPDSPQAPQAHYILGSLAAQQDDEETARAHFEKYLQLQPEGPQAEEVKKFLADLNKPGEG